jgi:hypothetical protein
LIFFPTALVISSTQLGTHLPNTFEAYLPYMTGLRLCIYCCLVLVLFPRVSTAQTAPQGKSVRHQLQTWVSINSTFRLEDRWGLMADFHIRRNNFVADPSFYFVRLGPNYWIRDNMSVSAGYAHLWLAPPQDGLKTWSNEHRIYQQFVWSSRPGKVSMLQRLRNEQRWQQKIANDERTGEWRFTNRFRYLLSFTIPLSPNPKKPSLVLADEILLQAGKEVIYNPFDQNRIFIGIRQNLSRGFSYDFGYMNVFQQKYSGYEYDMNHTIRLFFYYSGGRNKQAKVTTPEHHDE